MPIDLVDEPTILADMLEGIDRDIRQSRAEVEALNVERCLIDFKWFCKVGIWTVYTDPETETRAYARYPDYPYLDDYTRELNIPGLLAIPKSREMLATTHPLIQALHECMRVWKMGGIWRTAIVRQNKSHANELIGRTRESWARLPDPIRPPLLVDNADRLRFVGGAEICALPEDGETGRGEDWDSVILDEGSHQPHLRENIGAFAARTRLIVVPSTFNGEGDDFCQLVDGIGYPGRRVLELFHNVHPDRIEGTPKGDAYLANKQAKMSVSDFLREIKGRRDVYSHAGYYGLDYKPECVRDVDWDNESIVTIGMDYSPVNPGAVILYDNVDEQVCVMREYLQNRMPLEAFCDWVFGEAVRRYRNARFRVAPDPFRGRQSRSDADDNGNPMTDYAAIVHKAEQILGRGTLIGIEQTGRMLRVEGHRVIRRLFVRRDDKKLGIIIDSSCTRIQQGFAGAYGPQDNATPSQLENEEPDAKRIQVHLMDALRYGVCEFVKEDRGLAYQRPNSDWRDKVKWSNERARIQRQRAGLA